MLRWILKYPFHSDAYVFQSVVFRLLEWSLEPPKGYQRKSVTPLLLYLRVFRPEVLSELNKFLKEIKPCLKN